MKSFEYTITDEVGIHARPAGLLVNKAKSFKSDIKIIKGEKSADAKRLFALMGLAVKQNETIKVEISGEDEDTVAAELETFFKENL